MHTERAAALVVLRDHLGPPEDDDDDWLDGAASSDDDDLDRPEPF